MSSSTIQFVVAGALIVAWAWMLGRPLLTSLFRRSRRDSVGHFRYQQAVLSQQPGASHRTSRSWSDRPRPLLNWRSQPLERRRLQVMLGFSLATFVSLLMAIALRGFFVRLFLVMTVCFVVYLCIAAYIGSVQLRRQQEVFAARHRAPAANDAAVDHHAATGAIASADQVIEQSADHVVGRVAEPPPVQRWQGSVLFPEPDTTLEEHDAFGGVFDDDFFEPIPELSFEPLNLDASLFDPAKPEQGSLFGESDERDHSGEFFEQLVGRDETGDSFAIDADGWIAEPVSEGTEPFDDGDEFLAMPAASADVASESVPLEESLPLDESDERREPTFTAAPVKRQRPPKRNKARPIYIESQLDEGDDQIKAVND